MRTLRQLGILAATLVGFLVSSVASGSSISVVSGSSPAGGYLPLSIFGIAPISGVGDETITNFTVPSFSFAGQAWNRLGIVSNGYAIVGGGMSADVAFNNSGLPNTSAPKNILAPFWTDLNPAVGGAIRIGTLTDGANTWIVVDWNAVPNFGDATITNSFELWIGITGDANPGEDITFAYGDVGAGDGGFLTVGAQDISGTVGATRYFNGVGTIPTNGTELRVITEGLPVAVPEPGTITLIAVALLLLSIAHQYTSRKRSPVLP